MNGYRLLENSCIDASASFSGLGICGMNESGVVQRPSFKEALRFWFKLGWISFGGTAAHIAILHEELVQQKRWISNRKFLLALSHCMILPGPEAQQLAIYIGWKLHGKRGGLVAGTLFVLPSMFVLLALSIIYVSFGSLGVFGLVEMVLFILTVFVAYAYVWRRGGLEWD